MIWELESIKMGEEKYSKDRRENLWEIKSTESEIRTLAESLEEKMEKHFWEDKIERRKAKRI